MKFVNAIYAGENTAKKLWLIITWFAVISTLLFSSTIYLVFREPLIIERACESKVMQAKSSTPTKAETESFINEAMSARFNTDRDKPSLMTEAQVDIKIRELKELASRNISQVVFVDQINLRSSGEFKARLTRLLKIGAISTALGFEVEAKLFETRRTEDNPYGLILSELKLVESEVKK